MTTGVFPEESMRVFKGKVLLIQIADFEHAVISRGVNHSSDFREARVFAFLN